MKATLLSNEIRSALRAMSPQSLYVGIKFIDEVVRWAENSARNSFAEKIEGVATLAHNANSLYD